MTSSEDAVGPLPKAVVAITLTAGLALTALGLAGFSWPGTLPWSGTASLLRFLVFLIFTAVAVGLLARKLRGNTFLAALGAATLLAVIAGAVWPLLVTLWFALASSLLGRWLLQKLRAQEDSWLTFFLIGAGCYGTLVGLFAHFPVNYPATYGITLAAPLLLGRNILRQWFNELTNLIAGTRWKPGSSDWVNLAIAAVTLVYFVVALMPEVGHDALTVHLFVPGHLAQRHQWGFDAGTYVWALMPMMGDWVFSIVYMLGGETAARLINVAFILVLTRLVHDLVLWAGGKAAGAKWAALLLLSSPLTFAEGNSLFIESVWASFVVAGTLAILKASTADTSQGRRLTSAGALLGYALATKAVSFTFLPALLLPLVWRYKSWLKAGLVRTLLPGLCLFLMIGCIPYVTAWWMTGNPIFPYFNQIFHSSLWPSTNFEDSRWSKGLTWDFVYRVTFQTDKYLESTPGAAGFQWLLVFLPVLAALASTWHRRGLVLAAIAAVSILLCFQSMAYLRYIFPAYVVLVAAMGVGISTISTMAVLQARLVQGVATIAVLLNILFFSAGPYVYREFPLGSISDETHRDAYLLRRLPIRNAVKLVNALNQQGTPVAVFGTPQVAGLAANALMANWYNYRFQSAFLAAKTRQDMVDLLAENRVDFIIADAPPEEQKAQRALLDEVTLKLGQFGPVSVLRFRDEFRFNKELLTNPDFAAVKGWVLAGGALFDAASGMVVASESSPITQSVKVNSGQRYRNTVVARCHQGNAQGRVQVNWQDAKGQFLRPDIQLFACTPDWQEVSMEVVAPDRAARADVYATGHTATPLEFKSVSFKQ